MKSKLLKLKTERAKISVPIVFALLVILSYFLNEIENGQNNKVIGFGLINLFILSISLTFRSVLLFNIKKKELLTKFYLFGFVVYKQKEDLDQVGYLAIVPVIGTSSITFMHSTKSFKEQLSNLNLIYNKSATKRYKTIETGEREEILRIGKLLSESIQKPICETQGKDRIWLKE